MADNINNGMLDDPKELQTKEVIKEIPLFSALDEKDIQLLADNSELKTLDLGNEIAQKGNFISHFFYIYKGSLRKKDTIDGILQSLGKVEENGFLGEQSFLSKQKWDYTVNAASPETKVIAFDTSIAEVKQLSDKIKNKIAYFQLKELIQEAFKGGSVDDDLIDNIAKDSAIFKVDKDTKIISQGESNSSLFYVIKGKIDFHRENLDVKAPVGIAVDNDFFGEYGAMSGRQGYDAIAAKESVILEIPGNLVNQIFLHNDQLHKLFEEKVKSYDEQLKKFQGSDKEDENKDVYPEFKDTGERKIRKFPWMHQHEENDCGAACLTMISKYYGLKLSMGQVREMANVQVAGATMGAVCRAAENLGYRARPYKLNYEGLKNFKNPGIIHWQGYHWCVLFRVDPKHVWLADPAIGIRKLTHAEFKKSWTRYAIELEPTDKLHEIKPAKNSLFRFVRYLIPYKFFFFEIFIGSLVLNLLGLASPLFIQSIIDNVVVYKNVSLLNMMLLGMVTVTFFSTLTGSIQNLIMIWVTTRLDLKMLADFYKHVLSLPMSFFYSRKTGDIITRFGENSKVRALLSGSAISTLLNVIMVVVYLAMMFAYSIPLTVVVLAFIPFFIGLTLVFTPIVKRISNDIFMASSEQSSKMIESIQGIETIKANSIEWNIRTKWEDTYVKNVNLSAKMQRTQMVSGIISQTVNTASSITLLWFGAHLVINGSISLGEFMGFNAIVGSVMGPIMGLVSLYDQFQTVTTSMDRLNDVLELKPEEQTPSEESGKPKVYIQIAKGHIKFENISFRYGSEDSPLIFNNLNLEIKPGKTVAFVGKSGCGKSTLMKMVAGFNIPTSGNLLIDGTDIRNVDIYSLRRNIGWVLQDSFLFSGSVIENIALGDTNPDMDAVIKAAKLAAADEFIVDFPMGYKTIIGEKGMAVSGGQRQRICIARALYRDPQIILMDEATSALDAESERKIKENMDKIFIGRTAIVIAHRLSTVRSADMICYLGNGGVLEKGTHDELIKAKGLYYEMASEQFGHGD